MKIYRLPPERPAVLIVIVQLLWWAWMLGSVYLLAWAALEIK
jgi:hypothetical protein